MQRALVIFANEPVARHTKGCLAELLGLAGAAEFSYSLLRDTVRTAQQVSDVDVIVAHMPEESALCFLALVPETRCLHVHGGDPGERIDSVVHKIFVQGYEQVVLIESDVPFLSASIIEGAFAKLDDGAEMVFAPSQDGGYYLLGLTHPQPLLCSIDYRTSSVLYETLLRAGSLGVRLALLPAAYAIDTPADLHRLQNDLANAPVDVAPYTRAFLNVITSSS